MLSKVSPSGELLNRWRRIEEDEEENDDSDPSAVRRLNQRKEQWFTDAFTLLISLPKDTHIWCGHGDIMGPLIETFYNYFKDDRVDSPLKVLWKRISEEMRLCAQCICQHHQTQEMYEKEYECSSVGPLLVVLRKLDEERVTRHLQEINLKIEKGTYDPDHHHAEVVSVMYEVLMFPFFFDDMSLCTEFEKFIESIDNIHELAFAENQEFPVSNPVRAPPAIAQEIHWNSGDGGTAFRVSGTETKDISRPLIYMAWDDITVRVKGPAFEEGILEPYPIFVDTVLNHISGDSPEFSLAVNCLKELFKTLGMSLEALRDDSSLHISLRQPAIDLVQAILVSDATALLASLLRNNTGKFMGYEIQYDDDDSNLPFSHTTEDVSDRSWSDFTQQSKITLGECKEWMCIPMLWITTLTNTNFLNLPVSLSQAVFWSRSRFCLVESEKNDEMTVDIETWLSSSAVEIKGTLGWKVATGSDDGGPGKESKNSVTVSKMCLTLIRTLKRLTTCYLVQIGDECRKQWTWVPEMGETFILSLSDPDDNVRQFGKSMLEHVSNTRGLSCGLKFLCSQTSHLLFVSSGVRHVLQQLLKEEEVAITDVVKSSAGGFLRQPNFNALPMTCVRLLEILPVVLGKLRVSREESCDTRGTLKDASDLKWLPDLIDWGRSQLKVVVAYWKRALVALLDILQGSNSDACSSAVQAIRHVLSSGDTIDNALTLLNSDDVDIEQLAEQISRLVPKANEYQILKPVDVVGKLQDNMMDLTVDETEKESLKNLPSLHKSHQPDINKTLLPIKNISQISSLKKSTSSIDASKLSALVLSERDVTVSSSNIVRDLPTTNAEPSKAAGMSREAEKRQNVEDPVSSGIRPNLKKATDELGPRGTSKEAQKSAISNAKGMDLRKVVNETEVDPLDLALKSLKRQSLPLAKSGPIVPKRQVIQLCAPVNKKSDRWQRQEAGFKRFRPPKLEDWFRKILQMDYYAIVGLASTKKDESQNVGKFREVPVRFGSPEQYIQIFQPLVLEEFKAQLQSSFQEISSLEEIYYGVISVLSIERVDDFHFVRFMQDENDGSNSKSFSENDLVLFTKEHPENSNVGVNMMGKVEGREWDDKKRTSILNVRLYLQNASSRLNQARRNLLERSQWHASRILNITSQIREFQALSCIKDIPVLPLILSPMNDSNYDSEVKRSDLRSLPHSLQQILKSSFNESQLQAISVAIGSSNLMKAFDISLIQGPPGTGKTRTIVAIISGLLASASHKTSDRGNSEPGHSSSTSRQGMNPSVAVARAWQDAALAKQLNDNSETNRKIAEKNGRGRVLICAQSNAAVDELVSRISSLGIYGRDGKMFKPYLVRVGNAKTVHSNSMPFFLDTLVDQRLAEERMRINESKSNKGADSSALLRSNLEKVVDQITHFEAKRANINQESLDAKDKPENEHHNKDDDGKLMSDAELGIRLRRLYEQKRKIYKDLSAVQAQERKANYEMRTLKQKLRKSILKEAQIVVTTLSGCGGDLYSVCAESLAAHKFGSPSEDNLFDAVVIDEAAQALEPATLIPLQLLKSRGTKCIMVGDPKQLPATVLSNVASKFLYECSMFERLQRAGYPILMLTQQYRMHPEICRFPSMHFYDNKLLNGVDMSSKSAPFHENHHLGPYVFYDIVDGQEHRSGDSSSVCNEQEAEAAVQLLRFFKKRYPSEFVAGRIGIITPYKRQLAVLRSRFTGAFGAQVTADMEMNTVDGFQGKEVDILVLSTVRATHSAPDGVNQSRIGFVADVRRMNVALTRAKLSLWVLGNTRTLQRDHNWGALVKDAKEREVIIPVKRPYNYMFGENVMEQNHSENLPKNFPKPDKQHSRRKEQRAETSSDRKLRKTDGDVVPISSKGSESKHTRRNAKEEASSQREKLVASCEKVTSEETLRRSHEKKEKMKGREKSSNPEITDANSSKNENSNEWKKSKKASSKLDSSKRANPTDKIGQQDRQINKGNASNQGGVEDMISKRKQQREAVAAILNSSLIPSHKPKPPKRPLSPGSTAGSHTRPPKAIKGKISLHIEPLYVLPQKLICNCKLSQPRTTVNKDNKQTTDFTKVISHNREPVVNFRFHGFASTTASLPLMASIFLASVTSLSLLEAFLEDETTRTSAFCKSSMTFIEASAGSSPRFW
ncbi:Similar to tRNA-splicing endonuclease positive effector SEN1 [Arabidopsis thaliana]|uniref:F17F16.1 protein n=1 Tax=Arabidopsis thaliana TaxID=3702 RepID=Q9FWR3_ARATH|nr:Similar to tRNA-splicing endonuclease positive effector SEN1 [Arabidopsis thaliana]